MRTGIRMILCAALAAIAVTMAVFTLAGFTPDEGGADGAAYIIGVSGGNVAVYEGSDRKQPITVTDIELAQLREADRAKVSDGLPASSREELLQLLEDLGS